MTYDINPFESSKTLEDREKAQIWQILVLRDIDAFVAADWTMVEEDFIEEEFFGVNAQNERNPDLWQLSFPKLENYRDSWLNDAQKAQETEYGEDLRAAIHRVTDLSQIEINGNRAIAHKKFNGEVKLADNTIEKLNWQTLYYLKKLDQDWKIVGFTGYMPYHFGD